MAWPIIAGMAIAAGSSIVGGILGSKSATAQKKAIRKAAGRAYNSNMEYARDYEKSLLTNMTDYERDAAEYRDTMYQRTMANGGIRNDTYNRPALTEIDDYKFDIDTIDYEKQYEDTKKYYSWVNDRDSGGQKMVEREATDYEKQKFNVKADNKNTDALKAAIDNYEGRQPEWTTGGNNTALDVMRESTQDLQKDLNRTYVQGMQQVYYQRKQAYNNYQDMKAQADLYGLQSTLSLWSGLLGAGGSVAGGMAQIYGSGNSYGSSGSMYNNAYSAYNNPFAASSSASRYGGHSNY